MRFGLMETKVALTTILRNFRITLNEKTHHPLKIAKRSVIPVAEGGIWVNLENI